MNALGKPIANAVIHIRNETNGRDIDHDITSGKTTEQIAGDKNCTDLNRISGKGKDSLIDLQAAYAASAVLCITDRISVQPRHYQACTHGLWPAAIQPQVTFVKFFKNPHLSLFSVLVV